MKEVDLDFFLNNCKKIIIYIDGSFGYNISSSSAVFIDAENYQNYIEINECIDGGSCYFAEFNAFYLILQNLQKSNYNNLIQINTDSKCLYNTFSGDLWVRSWIKKNWRNSTGKQPEQSDLLIKIIKKILTTDFINIMQFSKFNMYDLMINQTYFTNFPKPVLNNNNFYNLSINFINREKQILAHDSCYKAMHKYKNQKIQ